MEASSEVISETAKSSSKLAAESVSSYRTYWFIWLILLLLTVFMILLEAVEFSKALTVFLLAGAMMVKATLIAGWFMHLRYERLALVLSVALGTLVTAAILYSLLIPDGMAMLRLAPPPPPQ